ncbi:queA, partial [Symbiodinium sp. KB8]
MLLSDFDYDLPDERIAQTPIEPRDAARLLVDRGSDAPDHRRVRDLPEILRPGDLLVVNETKVIPARLSVQRATGGKAEVLMLEPLDGERRVWEAMVRPARKLKPGEQLLAPDGTPVVEMGERTEAGDTFTVTVLGSIDSLDVLADHGEMPLPPYITERLGDPDRYQTVYAREPGSAAAPTAGLHFTSELLDRLAERGVETAKVELVVGLDTFRPVMEDDPTEHRMHTEQYRVPQQTMDRCLATRASGGRV